MIRANEKRKTNKRLRNSWFSYNLLWIVVVSGQLVRSISRIVEHHMHPEHFAENAMPWFVGIIIPWAIIAAGLLIAVFLNKKLRNK